MDVDAGRILEGRATLDDVGARSTTSSRASAGALRRAPKARPPGVHPHVQELRAARAVVPSGLSVSFAIMNRRRGLLTSLAAAALAAAIARTRNRGRFASPGSSFEREQRRGVPSSAAPGISRARLPRGRQARTRILLGGRVRGAPVTNATKIASNPHVIVVQGVAMNMVFKAQSRRYPSCSASAAIPSRRASSRASRARRQHDRHIVPHARARRQAHGDDEGGDAGPAAHGHLAAPQHPGDKVERRASEAAASALGLPDRVFRSAQPGRARRPRWALWRSRAATPS